ncbi:hypothetical protein PVK06_017029 [Gossypium arboreum]|uniref:DUF4283 domain-containing protein n=1 Tax=Gossypium arboreum TaxID=29729 RepID=A0ABR0Q2C6_GOSAR|nr:hypothetical protein PVK06_017029 [Gossypium arboreum]
MEEDLNALLAKLSFSEAESKRMVCNSRANPNMQGFEAWAVGKLITKEKFNREAMYRVLKSLWFTKEPSLLAMVPFIKRQILGQYNFNIIPFWIRVYNIPFEQTDRQVAIDIGSEVGEVMAIDWRDREGCWIGYIRIRIKIDVSKPLRRVVYLVGGMESRSCVLLSMRGYRLFVIAVDVLVIIPKNVHNKK